MKENDTKVLFDTLKQSMPEFGDLFEILELPDKQFKAIEPSIRDTITDAINQNANDSLPIGMTESDLRSEIDSLTNIDIQTLSATLSKSKREFLQFLIDSIVHVLEKTPLRHKITVPIVVGEDGHIPTYAHPYDACADIYAAEDMTILPHGTMTIRTDIRIDVPKGYVVHIYPRSGMSQRTHLRLVNSVGVIDSGYKDEIKVCFTNIGEMSWTINKGQRIAQMCIEPSPQIDFQPVPSLSTEGDREGGFGSSGE